MSRLIGLKIQGIRSVTDEPHVINFLDPLTIIQGENGTGKTTIIESLNYITTGTLPSGRLNSFIHNNKLSNKKRVDALIQLHFNDFRGNDCVATKRMCAIQSNKDKITTKSDEFTLKITESNGKTRSETAKVADFNRQIEHLFGVPSAILENVIFCHQEESTWPLGEPKELKTKFDAIFEVEKFVKVMDGIKKSTKDFETDLKIISAELPHLQRNMQHLGSVFMQLEDNARKVVEIREYLTDKETEKLDLEAQFKNLRKEVERAATYEQEISNKQNSIESFRTTLTSLEAGGKPYQGTKADLLKELNTLKNSDEYTEANNQKDKAHGRKKEVEVQIPKIKQQIKDCQTQINKTESKQHLLDSLKSEREKIIVDGLASFRMKNIQSTEFPSTLDEEIKKAKGGLDTFLAGKETQRQDLDKKLKVIVEKIAMHTNTDKMKRTECVKLKEQISRLEKEIEKSENSGDKNTKVQTEMAKRSEEFSNLQSDRTSKTDALKQKLFGLDVFPDVSTELGDVESVSSRLDELYISQTNSFKDFIRETVGEKAVSSENTRRDLNERRTQFEEAQNEMKQAFQSIQPLKVEQRAIEEQLKVFNKSVETERNMLNDRIQRMQNTIQRLRDVENKLELHEKESGSQNADECREKLKNAEKQLDDAQAEVTRLTMVIAECDTRNQAIQALENHSRIFDFQDKLTQAERELANIQKSLTRPSREFGIEAQKIARQINHLSEEMNKKRGAKSVLQSTEKDLRSQLKGEKIEDVKNKLKQKVIERVSMEAAIQDLSNLSKVMDDSIIQYHAQKMEQINSILNDLWPRVYQGNDIETIQIKSQPSAGNDKRKSYDYSVIMIVDQVEIEMRDRCSAGQKMLASMLIRIALAEVFGGNCPILALDEPTTNLDSTKVENMGTILKDLLEACQTRENHHNLQLIVITHDQRLVEHLFTACRPEYVYGLSKDENGTSRIRIHRNIGETMFDNAFM